MKFKYLGLVLDELGTDGAKCYKIKENGRKFAGAIRSLVNIRNLQFECARVLHPNAQVRDLCGIKKGGG